MVWSDILIRLLVGFVAVGLASGLVSLYLRIPPGYLGGKKQRQAFLILFLFAAWLLPFLAALGISATLGVRANSFLNIYLRNLLLALFFAGAYHLARMAINAVAARKPPTDPNQP
jgi:hypothetical protein